MAQESCLLFNSVHLENFVLHQDTYVEFNRPIMLLTGSNGSGKTLFLEGMLLAAGIKSQRIRDSKIGSILGGFSKNTRITLTINNPKRFEHRLIRFNNDDFDRMLDSEKFSIVLEFSKNDTNLRYFIQNSDKKYPVTKTFISQIFELANLDTRSKLAFTESSDVQELVSSSARKRFESFLKITGLFDRFTKVQELNEGVIEFRQRFKQIDEEKKRRLLELNELRKELEEIKLKDQLLERKKEIQGLQLWVEYLQIQNNIEVTNEMNYELGKNLSTLQKRIKESQIEFDRLENDVARAETKKDSEESSRDNLIKKQAYYEFQLKTGKEKVENMQNILEDLLNQKSKIQVCSQEEIDNLKIKSNRCDEEVKSLKAKYDRLMFELDILEIPADSTETTNNLNENIDEATKLIHDCFRLVGLLNEASVKFTGPIGLNLELENIQHSQVLAEHLTAFVIDNVDDLETILELVDENIKESSKNIVIRCIKNIEIVNNKIIKKLPKYLTEFVEFIKTDNKVINDYIKYNLKILILPYLSECNKTISEIVKVAQDYKSKIYIPELQIILDNSGNIRFQDNKYIEIYNILHKHRKHTIIDIENSISIRKKAQTLQTEIIILSDKLKIAEGNKIDNNELLRIEEDKILQQSSIESEIIKLKTEIENNLVEIEDFEISKQKINVKLSEISFVDILKREIADMRKQKEFESRNLGRLQNEETRNINELQRLNSMIEKEQSQAIEKLEAAKTFQPEKPDLINKNSLLNLNQELNKIDYKLSRLEHLNVTMEQFQKKEAEFEAHCQNVDRTKNTLSATFFQLEQEKASWNKEIEDNIRKINSYLQQMLAQRFSSIKVSLTDKVDIKSSGLQIEAKHRQSKQTGGANIRVLSGGERGIVTEAFIFATHLLINSPVHVIDEFTQRMDYETKALAFNIASFTATKAFEFAENSKDKNISAYKPHFILSCPDTAGLDFKDNLLFEHLVCLRLSNRSVNIEK